MAKKKKRDEAKPDTNLRSQASAPQGQVKRWWGSPLVHLGLLAALCFGVYANNYQHEFFLDDHHVLTDNLKVRSLSNIPQYFVDASTFSNLRSNVDYRPVLQVTYALNYAMGGYNTWWWHFTQIVLHLLCAVGVYLLCRKVMRLDSQWAHDTAVVAVVPLITAAVFAVHPTASGVVNYLAGRSSLLMATLLLPAMVLYIVPGRDARYSRTAWLAALCFTLALFSKVEAIACLAVFFLYDVWQTGIDNQHRHGFFGDLRSTLNGRTLKRLWPMLVVAVVYFVIRQKVMAPFQFDEARRPVGVNAFEYLLTQTTIWWQYLFNWFVPIRLVADDGNHAIYRSLVDGPVPLAIAAWLAIAAMLLLQWKQRPQLAFLAVSALALLSPTSSIAPLAEMLNEHRPYLPLAVLSLAWMIPLGALVVRAGRTQVAGLVAGGAAVLVIAGYGAMTWQRNKVFATNKTYLEDLVGKAPSGRTFNNYALLFMRAGDNPKALEYFTKALEYTPQWFTVHVNLGIVNRALGRPEEARKHFDLAVEYDKFSGQALSWRGENNLELGRFEASVKDFVESGKISLDAYRTCRGLATAYAGLGDANRSYETTRQCLSLDADQVAKDIVTIAKPFFDSPALVAPGLRFFELLDATIPNTWWVQYNLGTLAGLQGDSARAAAAHARGEQLKPH